jgi:hypothetical protein
MEIRFRLFHGILVLDHLKTTEPTVESCWKTVGFYRKLSKSLYRIPTIGKYRNDQDSDTKDSDNFRQDPIGILGISQRDFDLRHLSSIFESTAPSFDFFASLLNNLTKISCDLKRTNATTELCKKADRIPIESYQNSVKYDRVSGTLSETE